MGSWTGVLKDLIDHDNETGQLDVALDQFSQSCIDALCFDVFLISNLCWPWGALVTKCTRCHVSCMTSTPTIFVHWSHMGCSLSWWSTIPSAWSRSRFSYTLFYQLNDCIRENPPVFFLLTGAWNPDYPKLPEIWHDETYIQCNSVYKILQSPVSLVYRNLTIKIQRAAVTMWQSVTPWSWPALRTWSAVMVCRLRGTLSRHITRYLHNHDQSQQYSFLKSVLVIGQHHLTVQSANVHTVHSVMPFALMFHIRQLGI